MSEFEPVRSCEDLATLDETEMLNGYRDGRAGDPEPGNNRTRSYWHGWRNGAVDGGHREPDGNQAALAHDFVNRGGRGVEMTRAAEG